MMVKVSSKNENSVIKYSLPNPQYFHLWNTNEYIFNEILEISV